MLKGKNIYKSFDNIEVLKDINIEIERGKIVSIVGKSGAGKSTLLYISLNVPSRCLLHFCKWLFPRHTLHALSDLV